MHSSEFLNRVLSSQLYCPPLSIPTGTLALILAAHATTVFRNEQMCRGLARECNIEWILKAYWWKLKCRTGKIRTSLFQIFSRKRKKVIIADSNSNPKVTEYRQAYFINDPLFSQLNLLCPPTLTIGEKKCDINYYMLRGLSFFLWWQVIRFGKIPMGSLSNWHRNTFITHTFKIKCTERPL